jgi:hypothetical protein
MLRALPYPVKKRRIWTYAAAGFGLLAIASIAAWRFAPRHSSFMPSGSRTTAMATSAPARPAMVKSVSSQPVPQPLAGPRETLENLEATKPPSRSGKPVPPNPAAGKVVGRPAPANKAVHLPPGQASRNPEAMAALMAPMTSPAAPPAADASPEATGESVQEEFVQAQSLVREEDPAAFERINALLQKRPASPDLRLLKSQVILMRDPASTEARRELAALQSSRPEFMHPGLFHEQTLYLLWQADAAAFEAQKTPERRVNLLKSANAYLAEYGSLPAYGAKVRGIKDRLPR